VWPGKLRTQKDESFPGAALVSLMTARYETCMGAWTGRQFMRDGGLIVAAAAAVLLGAMCVASAQDGPPAPPSPPATAPAEAGLAACTKSDFETVVDQSAGALRDLNSQNRPRFQEKLRALRTKKAWTEDEFLKEAVPYVKDNTIDAFDRKTNELLNKIVSMGGEGSASATPDCGLYQELRGHMDQLVNTQNAKWAYMFKKIDAELGE
jgi:hypothetical protein